MLHYILQACHKCSTLPFTGMLQVKLCVAGMSYVTLYCRHVTIHFMSYTVNMFYLTDMLLTLFVILQTFHLLVYLTTCYKNFDHISVTLSWSHNISNHHVAYIWYCDREYYSYSHSVAQHILQNMIISPQFFKNYIGYLLDSVSISNFC